MDPQKVSSDWKLPSWLRLTIWITLGISMILYNKMLLTTWGFRFPFFLTCWHNIASTILTQILSRTTNILTGVSEGKVGRKDYLTKIVPTAFFFAGGLVLGNKAYQYISLGYIQMIKAFTPVPLLLMSFMIGRESVSIVQLGIVLVVSSGVLLSSVGELNFSLIGFVIQIFAVLSDCTRMLLMESLVKDLGLDSLSLLYYQAPTAALFIGFGFAVFEAPSFHMDILTPNMLILLLFNGLLAFSLNVAVIYLISGTSAVVIAVVGPLKDILIVMISVGLFHAPVTITQLVGFSISLFGLYLFRSFKNDPVAMSITCSHTFSTILFVLTCGFFGNDWTGILGKIAHPKSGSKSNLIDCDSGAEHGGDVEMVAPAVGADGASSKTSRSNNFSAGDWNGSSNSTAHSMREEGEEEGEAVERQPFLR
eukprot:CAMPEP_0174969650 /NCGR_PEP_ID=MMETSP0004_2-20121128/8896_1 /TAXON_ID=420556 /ORGANISM="Ochromonas sp., Strain CCMP1393" /LENGTH=421 /DNA_ID=CAMNT_0016219195 /DNA_START=1 /DNA_END=1266 /DNA_ORIENTATION=-